MSPQNAVAIDEAGTGNGRRVTIRGVSMATSCKLNKQPSISGSVPYYGSLPVRDMKCEKKCLSTVREISVWSYARQSVDFRRLATAATSNRTVIDRTVLRLEIQGAGCATDEDGGLCRAGKLLTDKLGHQPAHVTCRVAHGKRAQAALHFVDQKVRHDT